MFWREPQSPPWMLTETVNSVEFPMQAGSCRETYANILIDEFQSEFLRRLLHKLRERMMRFPSSDFGDRFWRWLVMIGCLWASHWAERNANGYEVNPGCKQMPKRMLLLLSVCVKLNMHKNANSDSEPAVSEKLGKTRATLIESHLRRGSCRVHLSWISIEEQLDYFSEELSGALTESLRLPRINPMRLAKVFPGANTKNCRTS